MNSKKQNDYDKYLSSMHAKLATPDEVIREIVKEGTNTDFVSKKRIVAGEVNEVYDITLNNNEHVILRISRNEYPEFQQEKWAIEQARKVGVLVPEIILIKYVPFEGKNLAICLMEKIDGEPLERGNIDFNSLDIETKRKFIRQAGEILSKIHSISTTGFGWIVEDGKAQFKGVEKLITDFINKQEIFEKVAIEENLDKAHIAKAMQIITSFKERYTELKPHLNHGDYSCKHFMVKEDKIVGILDWGGVRSDTPIYDFANWDYWFGEDIPTEWLKEGYTNKSLFDNDFEDFLHMIRIFKGLEIFNWYHQEKYKEAVEKAKAKLIKDLDQVKSLRSN